MTTTHDPLDRHVERERLPQRCPDWCSDEHARSLEEGCSVEDASQHTGPNVGHRLASLSNAHTGQPLRRGGAGWEVKLLADYDGGHFHWRAPYVELATDEPDIEGTGMRGRVRMDLMASEARSLAAVLLRFADLADFEG